MKKWGSDMSLSLITNTISLNFTLSTDLPEMMIELVNYRWTNYSTS
jgi:hypothetical protein